jgi:hypothetical protein
MTHHTILALLALVPVLFTLGSIVALNRSGLCTRDQWISFWLINVPMYACMALVALACSQ